MVSVIHWPEVQNASPERASSFGSARAASAALPASCSTRAAPSVIASGQP